MARNYDFVRATNVLVFEATPTANDTVTVNGRVYTFVASPSTANQVAIGASATAARNNLLAALNVDTPNEDGPNADVFGLAAVVESDPAIVVYARTPGSLGNLIATTSAGTTEPVWAGATLVDGEGDAQAWATDILTLNQMNSEMRFELLRIVGE